jgi:hypothetical protein
MTPLAEEKLALLFEGLSMVEFIAVMGFLVHGEVGMRYRDTDSNCFTGTDMRDNLMFI